MANKNSLTNPDNVTKAQADSSPELSSVFKEMKNGVDIQPLDDISQSEYVEFEDNVVADSEVEEKQEELVIKSQKTQSGKKRHIIQLCIAVVLIIVALVGIYIAFFHSDDFTHGAVAVYEKNSAVNVLLDNDDVITLEKVNRVQLSDDGNILVYSQDTDSKTGKYDIRVIDFSKRSSVKNSGSIIVSGIDSDWEMDNNGDFIYYQKEESGSTKYYAYSTEENETQLIIADATDFFTPPKGDIVYYTRERADRKTLFRVRFGEEAESIGEISDLKAVKDDEVLEIFCTVANADVNKEDFTLYKISGDSDVIKIADNVSEVYLDDYVPGGNLYYFVKNDAKVNWTDFVEDSYADSDATAQKPSKDDYMITIGFIFKRTKLNETAYNRAMESYNKILKRKEIRAALDKLDLGLSVSAEYKIKAYDGQLSKELASSVKLNNLIAFAKTGAPRIIYKTSGIDSNKIIDINSLYEIAVSKTIDDAMDYVRDALNNDYDLSTGCKYSWFDGNKVLEYDFNPECDIQKADFTFMNRNLIVFSVSSGNTLSTLHISTVGDKDISKPVKISDKVVSFETDSDKIYYTKQNGEITDLYVSGTDAESTLICENNIQYFINDDTLVAFKGENLDNAEIMIFADGESKSVDKNVSFKHFWANGESFAYIKNYQNAATTDTDAQIGGEMMVYNKKKSKSVDTGVSAIYNINY